MTSYFTFGHGHVHSVDGFTYDKDVVLKLTADYPRGEMFKMFGPKWAMEYSEPPNMEYFPRGIHELDMKK